MLLNDARHPLLQDVLRRQRKTVVPISLELDESTKTLLISGPNTGGKTVTLKTVGLLTLMAQSGLPVPAAEAEFPIFGQVLADIGDNQSIQESLSTFSAHISHIREMALDVTPDSLVLLDELGAATDPEEGGALGVAIVEHFRAAGAYTLASTHLLALKIYGANTKGVLNASMGFDEQTLEPTYVLHTGMPGKSAGLEIATRLGMPEDIMNRARAALSDRERDLGRFLSELHQRLKDVQGLEAELRRQQAELAAREKEIARANGRSENRQAEGAGAPHRADAGEIRRAGAADHRSDRARRGSAQGRRAGAAAGGQDQARVARRVPDHGALHAGRSRATAICSAPKIEEGVRVRLQGIREPARVRRMLGGDRLEVEAGFMKMQVSVDDVLEVLPDTGAERPATEERDIQAGAGAYAGTPGDQRDRPARRRSPRQRGSIPGSRGDGYGQPRTHRTRPRHGNSAQGAMGIAGAPSPRGEALPAPPSGGRHGGYYCGASGVNRRYAGLAAAGVLLAATVLFYWKILLTTQFSLLTGYEGANQAYAWLNFWVHSVRQGGFPLWDPYAYCGRIFAGKTQNGAFYPLYLPLALVRLNQYGLLPPSAYHAMYCAAHFLGRG